MDSLVFKLSLRHMHYANILPSHKRTVAQILIQQTINLYFRSVPEPKLVPSEPTDEQVNAAVKVVKKLKLKNYDVEQFENPALQAHFRMIESLALFKTDEEEICDTTMPGIY